MSFWKFINSGRKAEENMYLQLNGQGNLMIRDTEKAEVLSALFCLCYQACQVPEPTSGVHGSEMIQTVEEDTLREHLRKLDMHLQVHRTIWEALKGAERAKLCYCVCSVSSLKGHGNWGIFLILKKTNNLTFKKGKREVPGS